MPPEDRADFENDLGKAAVMKFFHKQEEHFKDEEREKETRSKEGKILLTDIGKKAMDVFVSFVETVEPILDVVVPSTPEYAVPYACLKLIFKASALTNSFIMKQLILTFTVHIKAQRSEGRDFELFRSFKQDFTRS